MNHNFTPTDGNDLGFSDTMVTFVSSDINMNNQCRSFNALQDMLLENPETLTVSIASVSPSEVLLIPPRVITITITDNGEHQLVL